MKRILVFSHALELGGAERALLGLLETFDKTQYVIDLFLMRHTGELMPHIPEGVNLLPEIPQYACMAVPMSTVVKRGQFGIMLGRVAGKLVAKKRVKKLGLPADNDLALQCSHKYTLNVMPAISEVEYDLAISFLTPHYYVTEKVKAKKKIAWIHTDYSTVAVEREEQLKMWIAYDVIASISNKVTGSFLSVFPELQPKIQLLPNIMPAKYIAAIADAFTVEDEMPDDGTIKLLSIGRFCTAKNFDNVPEICSRIRRAGLNVKWYLIGYGGDEQLIRNKIAEAGMQEHVIILGKKENPYPYIRACDLYVQPSRYEGKCVSVIEAQMLHKPVVITSYATAGSQLQDGVDGLVVPQDNEGCAAGISLLLGNQNKMSELAENCSKRDYTNSATVDLIYKLIGE